MKKRMICAALVLAALLLLAGCAGKPVFGVSTEDDNSVTITADRGPEGSAGLGYLTVGENELVVVDATGLKKDGKIALRFMAGVLGSPDFPDEPAFELTVSGGDASRVTAEPGEYTVAVIARSKVTGGARVYTEPAA